MDDSKPVLTKDQGPMDTDEISAPVDIDDSTHETIVNPTNEMPDDGESSAEQNNQIFDNMIDKMSIDSLIANIKETFEEQVDLSHKLTENENDITQEPVEMDSTKEVESTISLNHDDQEKVITSKDDGSTCDIQGTKLLEVCHTETSVAGRMNEDIVKSSVIKYKDEMESVGSNQTDIKTAEVMNVDVPIDPQNEVQLCDKNYTKPEETLEQEVVDKNAGIPIIEKRLVNDEDMKDVADISKLETEINVTLIGDNSGQLVDHSPKDTSESAEQVMLDVSLIKTEKQVENDEVMKDVTVMSKSEAESTNVCETVSKEPPRDNTQASTVASVQKTANETLEQPQMETDKIPENTNNITPEMIHEPKPEITFTHANTKVAKVEPINPDISEQQETVKNVVNQPTSEVVECQSNSEMKNITSNKNGSLHVPLKTANTEVTVNHDDQEKDITSKDDGSTCDIQGTKLLEVCHTETSVAGRMNEDIVKSSVIKDKEEMESAGSNQTDIKTAEVMNVDVPIDPQNEVQLCDKNYTKPEETLEQEVVDKNAGIPIIEKRSVNDEDMKDVADISKQETEINVTSIGDNSGQLVDHSPKDTSESAEQVMVDVSLIKTEKQVENYEVMKDVTVKSKSEAESTNVCETVSKEPPRDNTQASTVASVQATANETLEQPQMETDEIPENTNNITPEMITANTEVTVSNNGTGNKIDCPVDAKQSCLETKTDQKSTNDQGTPVYDGIVSYFLDWCVEHGFFTEAQVKFPFSSRVNEILSVFNQNNAGFVVSPIPPTWNFRETRAFIYTHAGWIAKDILHSVNIIFDRVNNKAHLNFRQFRNYNSARVMLALQRANAIVDGKTISVTMESDSPLAEEPKRPASNLPTNCSPFNKKPYKVRKQKIAPFRDGDITFGDKETFGLSSEFLKSQNINLPLTPVITVECLPREINETEIRHIFGYAGIIIAVIKELVNNYCIIVQIEYDHPLEAVQAISMFNHTWYYGNPLVVRQSSNTTIVMSPMSLPKGITNIGPGLGNFGKILQSVRLSIEVGLLRKLFTLGNRATRYKMTELKSHVDVLEANIQNRHKNKQAGTDNTSTANNTAALTTALASLQTNILGLLSGQNNQLLQGAQWPRNNDVTNPNTHNWITNPEIITIPEPPSMVSYPNFKQTNVQSGPMSVQPTLTQISNAQPAQILPQSGPMSVQPTLTQISNVQPAQILPQQNYMNVPQYAHTNMPNQGMPMPDYLTQGYGQPDSSNMSQISNNILAPSMVHPLYQPVPEPQYASPVELEKIGVPKLRQSRFDIPPANAPQNIDVTAKPAIVNPAIANPAIANPIIAKPTIAKLAITKPEITKTTIAKPALVKPAIVKPGRQLIAIKLAAPAKPKVKVTSKSLSYPVKKKSGFDLGPIGDDIQPVPPPLFPSGLTAKSAEVAKPPEKQTAQFIPSFQAVAKPPMSPPPTSRKRKMPLNEAYPKEGSESPVPKSYRSKSPVESKSFSSRRSKDKSTRRHYEERRSVERTSRERDRSDSEGRDNKSHKERYSRKDHEKRDKDRYSERERRKGSGDRDEKRTRQLKETQKRDIDNYLIIQNLPSTVTTPDLKEKMREIGDIIFADLKSDGRAEVCFKRKSDAETCILMYNMAKVDHRTIEVKWKY